MPHYGVNEQWLDIRHIKTRCSFTTIMTGA
jgi:hypothetical protein